MSDVGVLIVDDEDFYLKLFSDILAGRRYRVKTVHSGEEALSMLRKEQFDIIITDLMMDGIDGLVLTEKVRENYPWVDIIVITQRDDVRLAVKSMRMGVFEYLVKPVDRDELLLTLDRLLERRRLLDRQNKLLDESMQYLHAQTIYRRCLEILSTLDFENLCEMILGHLIQATGAQGGLLWLTSPEDRAEAAAEKLNLAGYRGLVAPEDFPTAIAILEDSSLAALRNGTPFFASPRMVLGLPSKRHDRDALFIPLIVEDVPVGLLLLLDKLREDFTERDQNIASTMAEFSAIALKNSRRFQALERVGLRDQGSTAYNMTYFIDYAGKEIYKARRYERSFSLISVVIDRYDFRREHFKSEICLQMSRKLAESISRVVRDSDILAKVSDHEYYLLLPETDAMGAQMFVRRSREAFWADPFISKMSTDYPVSITLGAATFPLDGSDFDDLLGVCRDKMYKARASLYQRLHLTDKSFWEMVEILIGRPEDYEGALEEASSDFRMSENTDGSSAHGVFDEVVFEGIQQEISQQAVHGADSKAILYEVGGVIDREPRAVEKILAETENARVFVVGSRGKGTMVSDHPALTRVFLSDDNLDTHRLLLVLSERLAYAFLGVRKNDNEMFGFHTHDQFLVENLIAKLQDHYNFQRQY
ncbi:MAG: response regulator [Deltaproteobacteria bacterium]|nr:response regulator [Deltaproteobacteria bacterium]